MLLIKKNSKKNKDLELQYEKNKLHLKYIVFICIGVCGLVITASVYNDDVFIAQLGLAGTITSIVLSVIAIIMSITGESKTEGIRTQMLEITEELRDTVEIVKSVNSDIGNSIDSLKGNIAILHETVKNIPEATAQRVSYKQGNGIMVSDIKSNEIEKREWIQNEK